MSTAGGTEPAYEAVLNQAVESSELLPEQRQVLQDALAGRIRRNTGKASHDVDQARLSAAVEQISAELRGPARSDAIEQQPLSVRQVDSVIDDLCERYHLPWPICPADD